MNRPGLKPEELIEAIKDADALVIRSATKVTAELISAAPRLKVVGRAGTGLDNVDIPAASKRGIVVMNTPGGNTITTARTRRLPDDGHGPEYPPGRPVHAGGANGRRRSSRARRSSTRPWGSSAWGASAPMVAERALGLRMRVIGLRSFYHQGNGRQPGGGAGHPGRTVCPLRLYHPPHPEDQGNRQAPGPGRLPKR